MRTASDALALLLNDIQRARESHPEVNWSDALAYGQLASKVWLVDVLARMGVDLGTVHILGGWLGTLSSLMLFDERLKFKMLRSFDIDPKCEAPADLLNIRYHDRFKAITADVLSLSFSPCEFEARYGDGSSATHSEHPDTIINTSCDHMPTTWLSSVRSGTLIVAQNNNFRDADETHTNTVLSCDEFEDQLGLTTVFFSETKLFPKYARFMTIGIR